MRSKLSTAKLSSADDVAVFKESLVKKAHLSLAPLPLPRQKKKEKQKTMWNESIKRQRS